MPGVASFVSFGECYNLTKGCYGNGSCVSLGRNWTCSCKFFFNIQTSCATTVRGLWNGTDMFFWVSGLILISTVLVLCLIETACQFKHKKLRCNEMTTMRFVLIASLFIRGIDYSLWGYLSTTKVYCYTCEQVQLVVAYIPYYLYVLALKICVVVWFNLMLSIENMSFNHFKSGRNIYIVISVLFATVGLVLILGCAIFSYTLFRPIVNYTITIPLLGTNIHSTVQVFRIFKKLKGAKSPKAIEAYRKNNILGGLSLGFSIIIILVLLVDLTVFTKVVNYWTWLIIFSIMRLVEFCNYVLFFLFSEQYTFSSCHWKRKSPVPV